MGSKRGRLAALALETALALAAALALDLTLSMAAALALELALAVCTISDIMTPTKSKHQYETV